MTTIGAELPSSPPDRTRRHFRAKPAPRSMALPTNSRSDLSRKSRSPISPLFQPHAYNPFTSVAGVFRETLAGRRPFCAKRGTTLARSAQRTLFRQR